MNPTDLMYTKNHEWIRIEENKAVIGITDHAQQALGDVVFVELPQVGDRLEKGKAFGVVESVKAVSDIFAPVGGIVSAVNDQLLDSPEIVNADPCGKGWMVELAIEGSGQFDGLLDAARYEAFLQEEAGQ